jgi:hypothetical protein
MPRFTRLASRTARFWASSALLLSTVLPAAHAAIVTVTPSAYASTTGTDSGQAVAASLALLDQSGTTDTWAKYVEYTPAAGKVYSGTTTLKLPASVVPANVSAMQLTVNYRGPSSANQTWTWRIYNRRTAAYVTLGTNGGAPSWGSWKQLSFAVTGAAADYINSADGGITLQMTSSNASDSADIDYIGMLVTYTSGGTGGSGPVTGVTVTPASVGVAVGASQQLTASVKGGANSAVTWSVNTVKGGNSTVGTVSATGLYVAPAAVPAPGTVTVRATSQADATKFASASITVKAAVPVAPVTVTLTPASAQVEAGRDQQFTASVANTGNTAVTWQVNGVNGGSAAVGTISATGKYTAPAQVPSPATITIKAISQADTSKQSSTVVTIVAAGSTFYVATNGSDTASGSISAPWKTITRAVSTAKPGDTIQVRGGVYNETVKITRSGTAALPIVLQSYPGEQAILDGKKPDGKYLAAPEAESGMIWLSGANYVTVAGFEVRNFTSSSSASVPVGIFIDGKSDGVKVLRNHIHHISNTSTDLANRNALGLAAYGNQMPEGISNMVISGNELNNLTTGWSESMTVNGNVHDFEISKNTVHDNDNIGIDAIGFEGKVSNASYDQARDGVISDNLVYNISSGGNPVYKKDRSADGIYVDGGTRIVIERNVVHHADFGIELASEHAGKATSFVTARNNLVWSSFHAGVSIGGYDADRGSTDHISIVNNTLLLNDVEKTSGEFQIQFYATNIVFKNNIVYAAPRNVFLFNTTTVANSLDMDYNLYYSTAGANTATFNWGSKSYQSLINWQATGKDGNSRFADPQLTSVSTTTPNLKPLASSPAISRGIDLGATVVGTLDAAAQPRLQGPSIDIGAYEQ